MVYQPGRHQQLSRGCRGVRWRRFGNGVELGHFGAQDYDNQHDNVTRYTQKEVAEAFK